MDKLNMTKAEIIAELDKCYGIEATLRARKSTLTRLLFAERYKAKTMDEPDNVTWGSDIDDFAMANDSDYVAMMHNLRNKPTKSELALRWCVGFLVVFHVVIVTASIWS